jgi:hypothetical protein
VPAQHRGDLASRAARMRSIADFRKDNGTAIRKVCPEFIVLCRKLDLLRMASVCINGSLQARVGPWHAPLSAYRVGRGPAARFRRK